MESLWGEPKAGNAGMVASTATAVGDLIHTNPVGKSSRIIKVLAYNGAAVVLNLILGTRDNAGAFVQLLPELQLLIGVDNIWVEREIPFVEFIPDTTAAAGGVDGNIYFIADNPAVAGVLGVVGADVSIEVREKGG